MSPLALQQLHYLAVVTNCKPTFFGLIPWYQYLTLNPAPDCSVINFNALGAQSGFLLIGLAIVDDLLRIAGLAAVLYVMYGGFRYVTSQGSPEEAAKAQSTIINGLIGLAIALIAIATVAFIGNTL